MRTRADQSFEPGASPATPAGDPARDRAFATIARHARRYPLLEIDALDTSGLDPRDAALAHAIVHTTVTRWLTLAHVLSTASTTPFPRIQPEVRGALLAGAAQLLLFDRIPPYAAVDHAVGWTRRHARAGAHRFVNAVLRRVARLRTEPAERRPAWSDRPDELPMPDGSALPLTEPLLPDDPVDRIAVATSHPRALVDSWIAQFGAGEGARIALHSLVHPPVILNTQHATPPLPADGLRPHAVPGHHVCALPHDELTALLRSRTDLWVQDPASAGVLRSIASLRPARIMDVCAGQGTKTRQLAALFPDAEIIAADPDPDRRRTLAEATRHLPRVRVARPGPLVPEYAGWADLVVADVPCSNSGVLPRRPEARYRITTRRQDDLVTLQRQILADAIPLLAPDARVLYATCSLQHEENQAVADWAYQWHGFRAEHAALHAPTGAPGAPPESYSDGSFVALLVSGGERPRTRRGLHSPFVPQPGAKRRRTDREGRS